MGFVSTRGDARLVNAPEAILSGIAPDGGLYVPVSFPHLAPQPAADRDFKAVAKRVLSAFFPDFTPDEMNESANAAYDARFSSGEITPLAKVGEEYVLELFHGPTYAFKDVALSMLPRLMSLAKKKTGMAEQILILTATSGDTGSAALYGFANVPGIRIIVFYPQDGVSAVQKMQMVAMEGENIAVCGVNGNFDHCQSGVKRIFLNVNPPAGARFSSANSINIGRLVPQIAYYYKAYADLVGRFGMPFGEKVDFIVPTGNFGDILAGYYAKKCGLPIDRLVCASNANNVLTDFFRSGAYNRERAFYKTASPSMDILISSNLERLIYDACGGDGAYVRSRMLSLSQNGAYRVDGGAFDGLRRDFIAGYANDAQALDAISRVWREHNYLLDPHTATAWKVMEDYRSSESPARYRVTLSTASPFKFAGSVLTALGGACPDGAFQQLTALSAKTGISVPANLKALEGKRPRFENVCEVDGMADFVYGRTVQSI